jgi:hypothetical protein
LDNVSVSGFLGFWDLRDFVCGFGDGRSFWIMCLYQDFWDFGIYRILFVVLGRVDRFYVGDEEAA